MIPVVFNSLLTRGLSSEAHLKIPSELKTWSVFKAGARDGSACNWSRSLLVNMPRGGVEKTLLVYVKTENAFF